MNCFKTPVLPYVLEHPSQHEGMTRRDRCKLLMEGAMRRFSA